MEKSDHWGLGYTDLLNAAVSAGLIRKWVMEGQEEYAIHDVQLALSIYTDPIHVYTPLQLLYCLAFWLDERGHLLESSPEPLERLLGMMEDASEGVDWWRIQPWVD